MNIKDKAEQAIKSFEVKTRADGTKFVVLNDDDSTPLYEAVREAHGDRFPDDFIYSAFLGLLEKVTEYEISGVEVLENLENEIIESQCDVYTWGLLQWLAKDLRNLDYLTEAMQTRSDDATSALIEAQYLAYSEVWEHVKSYLIAK